MFNETAIDRLTASVYTAEIHMSAGGGGHNRLPEIILNNVYIAALVALFLYAKRNYALGIFACPEIRLRHL